MKRRYHIAFYAIIALIVSLFITSCQSTGRSRTDSLESDLTDIQKSLSKGIDQVDKTVAALNALTTEEADLAKPYKQYNKELSSLESHVQKVRKQTDSLKQKRQAYFEAWQTDMEAISNEDLKKQGEQRKEQLKVAFDKIDKIKTDSSEMFDAFIANLEDIRKYLDTDLTPAGVSGISKMIKAANTESEKVKVRIGEISAVVEKIEDAMSSSLPQPETEAAE